MITNEQQNNALVAAIAAGDIIEHFDQAGTIDLPPLTEEPMVVVTVRITPDLYRRIKAAADDRGLRSTRFVRDLLGQAMADLDDDQPVTVRLSDLRRALDQAAHRAA